jgi:DNA damage-binding protein 1
MTAVDALDDDAYLGAENSFNLFTLRRNSDASTDEERSRLDVAGEFHLGEFVNRFRRGSLVAKARDAGDVSAECTLFGTVNGALGVLATLEKDVFEFALKVQNAMNVVVQGVGGLSHEKWRSFHNEHQTRPARGFVDGDVVERFLDLKKDAAKKVAALAGVSVEEITRRVEALQRVTH